MSGVRERLAQLEAADFDTFGEQDAGPGVQPLATPEEVEAIRQVLHETPWLDPARFPDCLGIAFETLATIAVLDTPEAHAATQALRSIAYRVNVLPAPSMPRGEVV